MHFFELCMKFNHDIQSHEFYNLLYGKNHSLQITDKNDWFVTSLQLKLH